jgi:Na+-transporting methylmalonyl-CoA/oxaloacetate decarboxylase gamma subunit
MQEALKIVVAGLGGVFAGMTLLYLAIRVTSAVAERMAPGTENDG